MKKNYFNTHRTFDLSPGDNYTPGAGYISPTASSYQRDSIAWRRRSYWTIGIISTILLISILGITCAIYI